MLFHIVEDCFVVIRSKGVYRQAKVFSRGDNLFAGIGSGYVRLLAGGGTTVPTTVWDFITPHPDVAAELNGPKFKPKARPVALSIVRAAE